VEPVKSYYPNGQLNCEGFATGKIQQGKWVFYYENGNVFSRGEYNDIGKPIGIWTEYYEDGQINYESISPRGNGWELNDIDLQLLNYWNENGIPLINNGEGKLMLYHQNGNIQHISHWKDYIKNGIYQTFYEVGTIAGEYTYKNNIPFGEWKNWRENGEIAGEGYYKEGKQFGCLKNWYDNGQLELEYLIDDDNWIHKNFWDKDGTQLLKNGNGKFINYHTFLISYYENYVRIKVENLDRSIPNKQE